MKCDCCGKEVLNPRRKCYGFCRNCWRSVRYSQDKEYRKKIGKRNWKRSHNPRGKRYRREYYRERYRTDEEFREKIKGYQQKQVERFKKKYGMHAATFYKKRKKFREAKKEISKINTKDLDPESIFKDKEFIERVKPPPRVKELLLKMPNYVVNTEHSIVLNAWNDNKKLVAYYVVDLAVKKFSTYVIGCHSKINYVPGASDLLCYEMIRISKELGKSYIHLGLGVSEGIRRFKKKWGGRPTLKYQMCELVLKKPSLLETILALR